MIASQSFDLNDDDHKNVNEGPANGGQNTQAHLPSSSKDACKPAQQTNTPRSAPGGGQSANVVELNRIAFILQQMRRNEPVSIHWAMKILKIAREKDVQENWKKSYHKLCLLLHPDKFSLAPAKVKDSATTAMHALNNAKDAVEAHLRRKNTVHI